MQGIMKPHSKTVHQAIYCVTQMNETHLTLLAWTEGEFHPPYLKTPFQIFFVNNFVPTFLTFPKYLYSTHRQQNRAQNLCESVRVKEFESMTV